MIDIDAESRISGKTIDPVAGNVNLLSLKANFIHPIHQADLQIIGKTIGSTRPYINIAKHFQMLSEMSVKDLATVGHSLGFGGLIDCVNYYDYNKFIIIRLLP
jgi:hypothetical protein